MKRFLKILAQLLLLWVAIIATLCAGAMVLSVIDPLHDVPYVSRGV